ncbi:GNAT family N-acetyltransferase [Nocardioides sp. MAHUQ-72]|uniref:GNAT family N-acetyltransferase n=1 Tax=unclassified Nocardioides TaxID=2615069 RepID=UPI003609F818
MNTHLTPTVDPPRRGLPGAPHTAGDQVGGVRRATPDDAAGLSLTLASAFRDDPVFTWCIPDPHQRDHRLAAWFRVVVDALLAHDETYCTRDRAGTALWVPPDVPPLTEEEGARLGAVTADLGAPTPERIEALSELMEARHPQDPHLYLWFAGVHAQRQGQGYGGHLLRSRLDRADEEGLPAYLEATSPRNRALYERHGFEVTGELSVDGSPPLWQMWREPRPARTA